MRRKKMPKNRHKGLYIYCLKCKKHFAWTEKRENTKTTEPQCGETKFKLSSCKNPDKHKYKVRVHIPGTGNRQASKTLMARQYKDAVIEAIEFENQFIENLNSQNQVIVYNGNRIYLFDAQIAYLDFLANVNVPEHQKVIRTEKHIKEQQTCRSLFNEALKKNKVDKKLIMLYKISDIHVGYYHSYLINDQKYQNKTYNNKMGALRSFFDWAIDNYKLNAKNPFNKAKRRTITINKDTISKQEFKDLLKIITPERGSSIGRAKNRSYIRSLYKPFLKDGIELALHTGGRREEVVDLKWNMIQEINNKPSYIVVNNLKVERALGEGFNDNVKPKIIPITNGLQKLLNRLGYNKLKNCDEYILCPDRTNISSKHIMESLSRGFSHYYKQLNTDRNLQFKCLRKTYLTYLDLALNGDTKKLSSHSSEDVLKKHYIDEKIVSTAIQKVNIFGS